MKIDIFIPPGRHSWNLNEGWVNTLKREGSLGRIFQCTKDKTSEILAYIPKADSDLMLLMGGDHHLYHLHDTRKKRAIWQSTRIPRVVFCYESILDSRFPNSRQKTGSAIDAFTHAVYCDEKDGAFFEGKLPAIWLPQCVDEKMFYPPDNDGSRTPKIFFRGKTDLMLHYDARVKLLEKLRRNPAFEVIDREISNEELAGAYRQHAYAINLPNNFFGYNVRTFEALASGCILFQCKIPDRPLNEALFTNEHLVLYDADNPDTLLAAIEDLSKTPEKYREMARKGREACLSSHTISRRIEQIKDFVFSTYKSAKRLHIGCGTVILPNYLNIDAIAPDPRVLCADAAKLEEIPDSAFDEIYANHILEHFPHAETKKVLEVWKRKLRPGGRLYVAVPDCRFLALALVTGTSLKHIVPPLMGGQEYPGNTHFNAFDRKTLKRLLCEAGYSNPRLFDAYRYPFTQWDCSRWPLSLNMTALRPPAEAENAFKHSLESIRILVLRYLFGLKRLDNQRKFKNRIVKRLTKIAVFLGLSDTHLKKS